MESIVTDNEIQFVDKNFKKLLEDLKVGKYFTSMEHPQTNGKGEVVNLVLLIGIKRRQEATKENWEYELPHVLWAYRTTPHLTTCKTPF